MHNFFVLFFNFSLLLTELHVDMVPKKKTSLLNGRISKMAIDNKKEPMSFNSLHKCVNRISLFKEVYKISIIMSLSLRSSNWSEN